VDLLRADRPGWEAVSSAVARDGVTAFVANLVTSPLHATRAALDVAAAVVAGPPLGGARLLGAALEGPFLSPQRAGVHPLAHLRSPDVDELAALVERTPVVAITVAPELPGVLDVVGWAVAQGWLVSLGHTACSAGEAHAAFDAGARAVTHLFNAMTPVTARDPGLAAVALARPGIGVQLVCDGAHLAPDAVRLALAAAPERWVLVTDAMAAAGLGDGRYSLGEKRIDVSGGIARDVDGTLAGSASTLLGAVREAVRCGAELPAALTAASTRPARLLGRSAAALGRLRPGDPADVVVLDDGLDVVRVLRDGEEVQR